MYHPTWCIMMFCSISDETVAEGLHGKYLAFSLQDSVGVGHLWSGLCAQLRWRTSTCCHHTTMDPYLNAHKTKPLSSKKMKKFMLFSDHNGSYYQRSLCSACDVMQVTSELLHCWHNTLRQIISWKYVVSEILRWCCKFAMARLHAWHCWHLLTYTASPCCEVNS